MNYRKNLYKMLKKHSVFSDVDLKKIINIQEKAEDYRRNVPTIEKICRDEEISFNRDLYKKVFREHVNNYSQKIKKEISKDISLTRSTDSLPNIEITNNKIKPFKSKLKFSSESQIIKKKDREFIRPVKLKEYKDEKVRGLISEFRNTITKVRKNTIKLKFEKNFVK